MYLEVKGLKKCFGEKKIVDDLSFSLDKGQLMCILGSSGCGKTTTLNMIGGFLKKDSGSIVLDGEEISEKEPEERPVTTVFQSYALFPHMTVLENVTYGLKFKGIKKEKAKELGYKYLEMTGMTEYADVRIQRLSGGQQQRVALARALVIEPKLCLLDEPFSNLDAALREKLRFELKRLQRDLKMTMIFVTHDQEEAMILSDKMAIMEQGVFVQCDTPKAIYDAPASDFVRDFLKLDRIIFKEDGSILKRISE